MDISNDSVLSNPFNRRPSFSTLWKMMIPGLIYKVTLDVGYASIIVTTRYSEELYVYMPDLFREIISYVLAALLLAVLYFDKKRGSASRLVIYLYTLLIIFPLLTMYGLGNASGVFVFSAIGCIVVLILVSRIRVPFKILYAGNTGVWIGFLSLICIGLFVYGYLLLTGGAGRLNFDLIDSSRVYQVRAEYVANKNLLMGYLLFWQSDILNTILILLAIRKRSRGLLITALFLQAALFGMTNFKMMVFVPVLVIFVYFFYRRDSFIKLVSLGFSAILLISFILYAYADHKVLVDLVSDRVFYFPANLHLLYYKYFTAHEHMHLSNSILSWLFQNPYGSSMPTVIAQNFFGGAGSPNTGYLATAYAEFGIGGMFVFSVILGCFLGLYDLVTIRIPVRYAAAMIAAPAMSFTNSAMFTTLLTGGFLLALVEVWLFSALFQERAMLKQSVKSSRPRLASCGRTGEMPMRAD